MSKRIIDLKCSSSIVGRSETIGRFFRDIAKYGTLTPEEEVELFHKFKHGTPSERKRAKEKLVNCNQRFVAACARKWSTESTWADYINEGNLGLIEAIETFDETLGFKFSTYAVHYIKRALVNYQQQTANMVKPSNFAKTHSMKARAVNQFTQKHERAPTPDELKDFINKSVKRKIKDTRDLDDVRYTYIDAESMQADDSSHADVNMDEYYKYSSTRNEIEEITRKEHNKQLLVSLIGRLNEREQKVLMLKYGIDGNSTQKKPELTHGEIAKIMGLTQERVRQIEIEAVKKLKEVCKKEKVKYA